MSQKHQRKPRKCNSCEKEFEYTAKQLKDHAALCSRAKKAGLVLAGGVTLK
jgi:hypothetical protein